MKALKAKRITVRCTFVAQTGVNWLSPEPITDLIVFEDVWGTC